MTTIVEKCPTCGADAINRHDYWEASPENGQEYELRVLQIAKALNKYYLNLDQGRSQQIAANEAFRQIQVIMGMKYEKGKMQQFLDDFPKLKPLYA